MSFSFTAAHEYILSASTKETVKMTMVVDSGASDHYVHDKLAKGIKQLMFDYQEFDTPRTITTSELHTWNCHREVTEQGHCQQRLNKNGDSTHYDDDWYRT